MLSLDKKYGKLKPLEPTKKRSSGSIIWKFRCDCGKISEHVGCRVSRGDITSCGCGRRTKNEDKSFRKSKYQDYKHGAKVRGLPFELSFKDFDKITKQECHYCGNITIENRHHFKGPFSGI